MSSDINPREAPDGRPQVAEDMRFQERTWFVQRIGWWAMGLFLLATLAGLFANGPLSSAETRDPSGLVLVEYERFLRHRAPTHLQVHLSPEAVAGSVISLRINHALAHALEAEKIVPRPQDAKVTSAGVEYIFGVVEPGRPTSIRLPVNPDGVGPLQAELGLSSREPARFTMFIYP